jgi:hypothetical protein
MDVVVDVHLMMSQDKKSATKQAANIVARTGVRREQTRILTVAITRSTLGN